MKNFIRLLFAMLVVFMLPVVAFAQDVVQAVADVSAVVDPSVIFASLAALVAAIMAITQWLKKHIETEGVLTKLLSWFVAVAVSLLGWLGQLGLFAELEWYWVLLYAATAGLVSNAIIDLELATRVLNLFKKQ